MPSRAINTDLDFLRVSKITNLITPTASGHAATKGYVDGLAGNALKDFYADVGNTSTTETDIFTYTISAGKLATNGEKIKAEYGGVFVSSSTATRQIKLYFGGTAVFDTGALLISLAAAWTMNVLIIRVSSSVVRYQVTLTTEGATLAAYTGVGELTSLTLANTQVLKFTGTAAGAGAATNDIVGKLGRIEYQQAAA